MKRTSFSKIASTITIPDLLSVQKESFDQFIQTGVPAEKRQNEGLQKIFNETFPIDDVHSRFMLEFVKYDLEDPVYSFEECKYKGITFAAPLKVTLKLIFKNINEKTGEPTGSIRDIIEQDVYLCNVPLMSDKGTFLINGVERVIVSQIHRSPGVFFTEDETLSGKLLYTAQLLPNKGSWLEFNIDINEIIYANLDRRKKFPATILLKAFGYDTNEKIFKLLFDKQEMSFTEKDVKNEKNPINGKVLYNNIVNKKTGEVLFEAGTEMSNGVLNVLLQNSISSVKVIKSEEKREIDIVVNTLKKDPTQSVEEAMERLYMILRGTSPATTEIAEKFIEATFFSPLRYELGKVGRYKLNSRLRHNVSKDNIGLAKEDLIETLKYLIKLTVPNNGLEIDDIDHLGNRRIRRVGELLENQFSLALSKMVKSIRERMMLKDIQSLTPKDLINARLVSSIIISFFSTSQLSQFMEQTNPLAELTHKRRISALGPGGLTRDTAGFEVRDVHHSHYGRICPIETPEGPNIGLITSLSTYARINEFGFIETPYRKVVKGKVTNQIEFLSADMEDKFAIAQANAVLNADNTFKNDLILCRKKGEYPLVLKEEVNYMDVSPKQIVSPSASMIPFLEHDDANRALMGSNMQRQAVPLLKPSSPVVGTGIERQVSIDAGSVIVAKNEGTVEEVTGDYIKIKTERTTSDNIFDEDVGYDIYRLITFQRTNQDTTIIQRPIVSLGQKVKAGEIIADGHACDKGEMALGQNIFVAFLPWYGYNFEDAIVVSEKLLTEDAFTSIHVKELEIALRETKLGPEEFTRELPNVSEDATHDLDEYGIIRIGAKVQPGDILVGKVTPKGEVELTPEEKLLRAIFGEKASDVRDTSLKVPPGISGVVVDVRVLSRENKRKEVIEKEVVKEVDEKIKRIEKKRIQLLKELLIDKKVSESLRDIYGKVLIRKGMKITDDMIKKMDFTAVIVERDVLPSDYRKANKIIRDSNAAINKIRNRIGEGSLDQLHGDELPNGVLKMVKIFIAQKRNLQVGDKLAGRHGNKGVVAKIVPVEDMPFLSDGTPVDIVLNPLGVSSRMNVGQVLETLLGYAGIKKNIKYASPVFDGTTIEEIKNQLTQVGADPSGKMVLYDGRTGECFDEKVTVGHMYVMKLSHMVEDKIHARATGPYSLISQQPLGGKAQFGGQRFGEMEVWALEAYGAAYTLQEILTVKSDDVKGRSDLYEAIVKGKNPPEPGLPAAFNVLVKEMNGLCLDVTLGKNEDEETKPKPQIVEE
ncbi:MAG: DNA-directed RNA polymerase subunit beta [bacterium]|nr:DNA-directed RNA polymerase subunit beta [bacterium]